MYSTIVSQPSYFRSRPRATLNPGSMLFGPFECPAPVSVSDASALVLLDLTDSETLPGVIVEYQ
ncbi:MAG: hypothetical protein S4CHLAM37_09620 [Chlamydiia bacterium]|nr:hypothetical protein [Chlamydiia bacterium]